MKKLLLTSFCAILFCSSIFSQTYPDSDLGLRASWMRGTYGLNWKPAKTENGKAEAPDLKIDAFLNQVKDLKKLGYIQVHLNESGGTSAVHLSPHGLIESFWEGDMQGGNPINLAVPRVSSGKTPLIDAMRAIKDAGLRVQIYANSANLLYAASTPQVSVRFKKWCDTNPQAQAFINSKNYHKDPSFPNRKYMFCYAEFILKDYAIRYGDLVDAWLWDTGRTMWIEGGDNDMSLNPSQNINDQRIYQAFAEACHAGNPDAAISFNNSPGANNFIDNPYTAATLFDDYTFGHPYSGGKNVGNVAQNLWALEWINDRNGYIYRNNPDDNRTWDDNIVGHWDPPMSVGQWNTGSMPGVPDAEFAEYYGTAILGNGAVSFGVPLVGRFNFNQSSLISREWGIHQLELLDAYLVENQVADTHSIGRIQAEDYSAMNGIQTEGTNDAGGGQNVGYIDNGDFIEYEVEIPSTGSYIVNYRVASRNGGGSVIFRENGKKRATTGIDATGGWQNWETLSTSVFLSKGTKRIRLDAASGGWNINWFELIYDVGGNTTNLALNGVANQSSTTNNGDASRAIDGNTNGSYSGNSVTHTAAEDGAWWTLDLATESNVDEIIIYNRTDNCCTSRLSNFSVFAWDTNGNRTVRNFVTTAPNPSVTINTGGVLIKNIRIKSNLPGTPLSLAEVEVIGSSGNASRSSTEKLGLAENSNISKDKLDVKLYPNPVEDQFTIQISNDLKAKYTLFDYVGKTIIKGDVSEGSALVDISRLNSGIYILKVDGEKESFTSKLIKK